MTNDLQLVEQGDHWVIPIQGREVTRCMIDHAFSLELWGPDQLVTFRLEGMLRLQIRGEEHRLAPDHPATLCPLLRLVQQVVTSARAYKDGRLVLTFADGSTLIGEADPHYEAWTMNGPNGLMIVGAPGKKLIIWQASQEQGAITE